MAYLYILEVSVLHIYVMFTCIVLLYCLVYLLTDFGRLCFGRLTVRSRAQHTLKTYLVIY